MLKLVLAQCPDLAAVQIVHISGNVAKCKVHLDRCCSLKAVQVVDTEFWLEDGPSAHVDEICIDSCTRLQSLVGFDQVDRMCVRNREVAFPIAHNRWNDGGCMGQLTVLSIEKCQRVSSLETVMPPGVPYYLCKLRRLILRGCRGMVSLPELPFNLVDLHVYDCVDLECLPNLPIYLEELILDRCFSLVALPAQLPSSLQTLRLTSCIGLDVLPPLPAGLRVVIGGCHKLSRNSLAPVLQ
jgi:hypothetical protein